MNSMSSRIVHRLTQLFQHHYTNLAWHVYYQCHAIPIHTANNTNCNLQNHHHSHDWPLHWCTDGNHKCTNLESQGEQKRARAKKEVRENKCKRQKGYMVQSEKNRGKKTDLCSHLDWFWIFLSNTFHPFDCGAILNQLSVENIATATSNYHGHRKTLAIYFWNERKHNLKSTKSTKQ